MRYAVIRVGPFRTLAVQWTDGSWWTDPDFDQTGISGHRHEPEDVTVETYLITDPMHTVG